MSCSSLTYSFQAQPPKLFYHSYGLDVNSNLKWNGKVNLNLLKYWHQWYEHKEQRWKPKQSIIIQQQYEQTLKEEELLEEESEGTISKIWTLE
nr:putative ubiquitin-conjugating enzyme e2 38 [Quercus suber]